MIPLDPCVSSVYVFSKKFISNLRLNWNNRQILYTYEVSNFYSTLFRT